MNEGELSRLLAGLNPWWKDPAGWEAADPDLRAAAKARASGLVYEPYPLSDVRPDGLYWLRGPRRVGKTLELKRVVVRLLADGVRPRRIIHCACDGMTRFDLQKLVQVGRDIATANEREPRYWLLDEITAVDGWPPALKELRDGTALRDDCVVITGSSNRHYANAVRELAGRHGAAANPYRVLLPMSFRGFARSVRPDLTLPDRRVGLDQLGTREFVDHVYELQPWLNELLALWEVFLQVGGYPQSVYDYLTTGSAGSQFFNELWDVIRGEIMAASGAKESEIHGFVSSLARRLAGPTNFSGLTRELGLGSTTYTARSLADALTNAFVIWYCYQEQSGRPNRSAYPKLYFLDPLTARIPYLHVGDREPEPSALTEQTIGVALLRAHERRWPATLLDFSSVMYRKTATRSEVDFIGPHLGRLGVEAKYVDANTKQEAKTLMAQFGAGVLVTRSVIDLAAPVRNVPASFLAFLLD